MAPPLAPATQELELERLSTIATVLQSMSDETATAMSAEFTCHAEAKKQAAEVDPMTDLRMFVHKRRVRHAVPLCRSSGTPRG